MTTIKSLKDMYVKLGGSLTDTYADIAGGKAVGTYATIPEMIQACTKKAGSGGGGGKDEILWINATMGNNDGVSLDKTYAEIIAAIEAGMYPIVNAMGVVDMPLSMIDEGAIVFTNTIYIEGAKFNYLAIDSENTVTVDDMSLASTESVSTAVAPFYVTFTVTNPDGFVVGSADKTFAEIAEADAAGKRIVGKFVATNLGQDVEIFEADVAARMFAEHGNVYVWQHADTETMMTVLYDVEGITSSVTPWGEILNNRFVVEFTQSGTDWISNRPISQIYEAWQGGKEVVGISGGIILQLIGVSSTEAAFNVTVTAGTKLAYRQFRQYIDGNDQEVVEVIEKSIVVE